MWHTFVLDTYDTSSLQINFPLSPPQFHVITALCINDLKILGYEGVEQKLENNYVYRKQQ